jgi:hypothetical protein
MVAVQRGVRAELVEVIDSDSYDRPWHCRTQIDDVHLNPRRTAICALSGSYDKIDRASRKLVCIGPAECHRLNSFAVHREGQPRVAALSNETHGGERNITQ